MRRHILLFLTICSGVTAYSAVPGQGATPRRSRPEIPAITAGKLVKLLELPSKRVESIDRLLRLGPSAVPALTAALNDPRGEIVHLALRVIGALGSVAQSALPALDRLAAGDDAGLAYAARWAKHKMRPAGITVIAEYTAGKVTEVDAKGKARTVANIPCVFDVERLANGNYLVVQYSRNSVREIDPEGKEVWSYKELNQPLDADRLPNGNTLIVERSGGKRVIEVTAKGKIVWEFKQEGKAPQDAQRLPNGNTLVVFFSAGVVVEVDPAGKIVWKLEGLGKVSDADRLVNGNTLLALHTEKIVREVDPKGKTVMEIRIPESASDADRLPNGHTLVAHRTAVVEYDTKGKEVWRRTAGYAGEVNRY